LISTVIIPVLNGYELLRRCVATLPKTIPNVLIIDNGDCLSRWDQAELDHPGVRILSMPSNLGVPQSWNLGIKLYPHEAGWLLINHDAYFDADGWERFSADVGEDRITLAGVPPWCCAWIGRGVVDRVGLFCEAFYPAYMEDVDYEERATRLGIVIVRSDARVRHDNSSTIKADDALSHQNSATHRRNIAIYDNRWHGLQSHEVPASLEWSLYQRTVNAWD
jgi:GT2 family glycosyltransferase